jgi:acyl carrier protein
VTDLLKEIKEKLVEALKLANVQPEEIGDDEPLFGEGLGLDSIDVLELAVMLERDYGVKMDSKELGQRLFVSVHSMADFVERSRARRPREPDAGVHLRNGDGQHRWPRGFPPWRSSRAG